MPRFIQSLLALVLCTLPLVQSLAAQAARVDGVFTVAKYLDYETVADPRLSPNGATVVYTRRWINQQEDRWESALWIMNADGSRNRFLAEGSGAVWSPDGTRIAYLAEGEPKGTQVWVRWMDAEGAAARASRFCGHPRLRNFCAKHGHPLGALQDLVFCFVGRTGGHWRRFVCAQNPISFARAIQHHPVD